MVSWVVVWLLAMISLVHSLPVGTWGLRLLSRDGLSSLRPPTDLIGLKKSGKQRTESSVLWLGEKRPEIFPLEDSEKPDEAGGDQEEYDDESEGGPPEEAGEASGRFKLKPSKQPMIFNTGSSGSSTTSPDEILEVLKECGSGQRQDGRGVSKTESPLSQKWYKAKQKEITPAQKRALREHWGQFGIDLVYGQQLEIIGGAKEVVLDIGFGTGDSIVHMAEDARTNGRDVFFFGCEIHRAGVAQCISEVARRDLRNVKLIRADATLLLGSHVPKVFFDEVHIYFPDPWPNAFRDGERRVVRSRIVGMLKDALKPGGRVHIATDVEDYANHVRATFDEEGIRRFFDLADSEAYEPCSPSSRLRMRGVTRYEQRAPEKGNQRIYEFVFKRTDADGG